MGPASPPSCESPCLAGLLGLLSRSASVRPGARRQVVWPVKGGPHAPVAQLAKRASSPSGSQRAVVSWSSRTPSTATQFESSLHARRQRPKGTSMKKGSRKTTDALRPEYKRSDFGTLVRGKYVARVSETSNIVVLEPQVARAFPNDRAVNQALRGLLRDRKGSAHSTIRSTRTRRERRAG